MDCRTVGWGMGLEEGGMKGVLTSEWDQLNPIDPDAERAYVATLSAVAMPGPLVGYVGTPPPSSHLGTPRPCQVSSGQSRRKSSSRLLSRRPDSRSRSRSSERMLR